MPATLSPSTALLIAAPVAGALFLLVLVLFASQRSRSPVATRLERDASRRERERSRAQRAREEEPEEASQGDELPGAAAPEREGELVARGGILQPGTSLAVPEAAPAEVGPAPAVRTQLETAAKARLVAPPVPARDPERAELDRRQFLNRGLAGGTALGLGIFGAASLAFLYPKLGTGFGGKVNGGKAAEAIDYFTTNKTPLYNPEGRFYVVPFSVAPQNEALAKAIYALTFDDAKKAGVMVIYQKCAHLGCRVPWCQSSQWFECPCHGSQYNAMGERQGGPAPRGLSRFKFTLSNGELVADTGTPLDAPPQGINTPGLPPPPQHCV
jgi:cytochrome b6-f complex iron-sulfur subunit